MKRLFTPLLLAASLHAASLQAEDIDIFNSKLGDDPIRPNVLFVIDNSANWDAVLYQKDDGTKVTKSEVIHDALYELLAENTPEEWQEKIDVGLMTLAHSNSPKGSVVVSAIEQLTSSYRLELGDKIRHFETEPAASYDVLPKTNNRPFALSFHEAYLYFSGQAPRSGLGDGIYSCDGKHNCKGYDEDPGDLFSGANYRTPVQDTPDRACAKNFIVFIANGHPDKAENTDAYALLNALGGTRTSDPIDLTYDNDESNWADEYARFLAGIDLSDAQSGRQNVTTYVIDVYHPDEIKTDVDRAARAYLQSIANQGQGVYHYASDKEQLVAALIESLNDILSVNTVFASSTLPVSINVRGTNLNQVYMGVFRPDSQWRPRWMGNLKLFKLAVSGNSLYLADANGNDAEERGFLNENAKSFWTYDATEDFWDFNGALYDNPSDSPDGKTVEKGAAAQRLRDAVIANGAAGRTLYTCSDADCGLVVKFSAASSGLSDTLVEWMYGINNKSSEVASEGSRKARASAHGDVLHSRPAVINYGSENDVVAYYGSNDGILHAVRGGKPEPGHDSANGIYGQELWGFIAPEFLPRLQRLYDNTEITTKQPNPYFFDGGISAYVDPDDSAPSTVHLFVSLRRGGRALYALDVSNKGAKPKVIWRIDNGSDGYGRLGQTWSTPQIAKYDNGGTLTPILIFGGGYDPNRDDANADPAYDGAAAMGHAIYAADPATGKLIWSVDLPYPVPSDVSVVDRDLDGDIDLIYAGDTRGNVWRVVVDDNAPGSWTTTLLASVGTEKFLFQPSVVRLPNGHMAVLIGSGDREDPFNTGTQNHFYMFEDDGEVTGLTRDNLFNATSSSEVDLDTVDGWYIELGSGEKVIGSPITVSGTTYFNTNQPGDNNNDYLECAGSLGTARIYRVNYTTGASATEGEPRDLEILGGGLPPSPVGMVVEIDNQLYAGVISGSTVITDEAGGIGKRMPRYWYKEIE